MSEKETNRRPEASTEDKMQELFRLMDAKAAQGTLVETEEDVSAQKEKVDTTPLSESETAAFEYNMTVSYTHLHDLEQKAPHVGVGFLQLVE